MTAATGPDPGRQQQSPGRERQSLDRERQVAFAGVLGQAAMLRSGELDAVALLELLVARITRLEPTIHAFRVLMLDSARADAVAADEARRAGDSRALLGVPVAVKDNVAVAGQASLLGTGSPQPVETEDDELVRRLRAAGMVVVGKTHLPELALWAATESRWHGITRNPWTPSRAPGGSSGGSAAAVAAGMVPAAHATDGLGSIRIPASACGLVGLKPTKGLVPLGPDPEHWEGMSHAGVLTRSVADTAAVLAVMTDGAVSTTVGPASPLRIAVSRRPATPVPLDAQVAATLSQAADALRRLGHTVVDADPPYGNALAASTTARYLTGVSEEVPALVDPSAVEPRTRALAKLGRALPPGTLPWARRQGEDFGARMDGFFTHHDLLLTPTMPVLPRRAGCLAGRGLARTMALMAPCAGFTAPWNACGLPAVSLPVGVATDGTPVGVQLVGPSGSEDRLLAVAAGLEQETGWLERRVAR